MTRSVALPPTRLVAMLLAAALSSLLLLAVTPSPVPAAPPAKRVAVQMDAFRLCLKKLEFEPLKAFVDLDPNDCILVLLGDTDRLTEVPGGLKKFLERGGAALIAGDEPMHDASRAALVDATGYSITGYKWAESPHLELCYHQIDFCPYMISEDPRFMRDPITQAPIKPVATNVPSILTYVGERPGVTPFAEIPAGTKIWVPEDKKGTNTNLFGAAGDIGNGRVIVLADHSIFINEMMAPKDTGNFKFTANCLIYLSGDKKQRKRVLFVDDGVISPSFESATKLPKPSPINAALTAADKLEKEGDKILNQQQDRLNEIDQRDGFNRWLIKRQQEHPGEWRKAVIILLVFATLGLLIYGCYRLGIKARHRTELGVLPLARAAGRQAPRGPLLALRQEGLLDADNVWEASRQLARDAFEAGGVAVPVPYREPAVKVTNVGWWRRSQIQRRVIQLWRLAFRNRPMAIAPQALLALAAELEQLKADLKRGTIQVA